MLRSLLLLVPTLAFVPHYGSLHRTTHLQQSSSSTSHDVPLVVHGNNLELTPALEDYVDKRIGATLSKLAGAATVCNVHLSVNKNPKVSELHVELHCRRIIVVGSILHCILSLYCTLSLSFNHH